MDVLHFVAPTIVYRTVLFLTLLPVITFILYLLKVSMLGESKDWSQIGKLEEKVIDLVFSRKTFLYLVVTNLALIAVAPTWGVWAGSIMLAITVILRLLAKYAHAYNT